jgi:cation transport ATPase
MLNKSFLKIYLLLFLFFAPAISNISVRAQSSDIFQMDEQDDDEDKKSKKKKKDKEEELVIDQRFIISFATNIFTMLILIGLLYYLNYQKKDLVFTYFIFNVVIFLLTFVFNHVKISMGAAFGMFAIFSMLRYRTEGISAKDMTYLFIVIATGLVNAIQLNYEILAFFNLSIIIITLILDGNILFKRQSSKIILYEKIELIKPENKERLIEDLRNRTGLPITKVSVNKIDFLRDVAVIEVFYHNAK